MTRKLEAYVDGSFNDNIPNYGSGVVLVTDDEGKKPIGYQQAGQIQSWIQYRNVAGELQGALIAINIAIRMKYDRVVIYHDLEGTFRWSLPKIKGDPNSGWARNNELTRYYFEVLSELKKHIIIDFVKVKAHSGNELNERADILAKMSVGLI